MNSLICPKCDKINNPTTLIRQHLLDRLRNGKDKNLFNVKCDNCKFEFNVVIKSDLSINVEK